REVRTLTHWEGKLRKLWSDVAVSQAIVFQHPDVSVVGHDSGSAPRFDMVLNLRQGRGSRVKDNSQDAESSRDGLSSGHLNSFFLGLSRNCKFAVRETYAEIDGINRH